jgi:hypothetical protein
MLHVFAAGNMPPHEPDAYDAIAALAAYWLAKAQHLAALAPAMPLDDDEIAIGEAPDADGIRAEAFEPGAIGAEAIEPDAIDFEAIEPDAMDAAAIGTESILAADAHANAQEDTVEFVDANDAIAAAQALDLAGGDGDVQVPELTDPVTAPATCCRSSSRRRSTTCRRSARTCAAGRRRRRTPTRCRC